MAKYFTVKTENGYVGSRNLNQPLTDTMPKAFAYTWDSEEEAAKVADRWNGKVES